MSSQFVHTITKPAGPIHFAGLAGVDPDVRKRAEKVKSKYLLENGETLLERMKIEVPRRVNWQSTGASHKPDLIAYYNQYNADPKKVANAWKSEFPDLFPGSINARYNPNGSIASEPSSGNSSGSTDSGDSSQSSSGGSSNEDQSTGSSQTSQSSNDQQSQQTSGDSQTDSSDETSQNGSETQQSDDSPAKATITKAVTYTGVGLVLFFLIKS